jgi:transposase
LAPWRCEGLAAAGRPVIGIDARHMKAAVRARPVKTDRIDARTLEETYPISHMMPRMINIHRTPLTPAMNTIA